MRPGRTIKINLNGDMAPEGNGITVETWFSGRLNDTDLYTTIVSLICDIAERTGKSKEEVLRTAVKEVMERKVTNLED